MLIRRVHFHGGISAGFWGPFRGGLICLGRLTKCIKLWEESVEGDFFFGGEAKVLSRNVSKFQLGTVKSIVFKHNIKFYEKYQVKLLVKLVSQTHHKIDIFSFES